MASTQSRKVVQSVPTSDIEVLMLTEEWCKVVAPATA